MPLLAELTKDDPEAREEQAAQIEQEQSAEAFLIALEAKRRHALEVARQTARQMVR